MKLCIFFSALLLAYSCSEEKNSELPSSDGIPDQESWGVTIIMTHEGFMRAKVRSGHLKKYNEIIAKKNKDLIDYQNKSKSEFKNALISTLADFAKDNSISIILSKEQVLIGVKNLDVTKEILDLVNKS